MAISSDPSVLAAASRCFDTCIPPGDQLAVKTYLLAQIAGVTDPKVVANNARCFSSCIPPGAQVDVQAYLAAVLEGGSLDPSTLLNNATCFRSCVPPGASTSVANYALANQAGGSTDPATLANLARCFSSCIPPGMQLAAQTYLLGVRAGITDPAVALTNARCFRCFDGSDPTVGDAMITRWVAGGFPGPGGGGGGGGPTPPPPPSFPITDSWVARVQTNGGSAPSAGTVTALHTFETAITSLVSRIYWLNVVAPDSLIAFRTPWIKTFGIDPMTSTIVGTGGGPEQLGTNGWIPSVDRANTIFYNTGVVPSAIPSFNTGNCGLSVYLASANIANAISDAAIGDYDGVSSFFAIVPAPPGFSQHECFGWSSSKPVVVASDNSGGFLMMSRESTTSLKLYKAKSTVPWGQIGATEVTLNTTAPNARGQSAGGDFEGATKFGSASLFSFWAIHDGFNSADGQILFNAVQALRTSFGGGFL